MLQITSIRIFNKKILKEYITKLNKNQINFNYQIFKDKLKIQKNHQIFMVSLHLIQKVKNLPSNDADLKAKKEKIMKQNHHQND